MLREKRNVKCGKCGQVLNTFKVPSNGEIWDAICEEAKIKPDHIRDHDNSKCYYHNNTNLLLLYDALRKLKLKKGKG